MMLDGFNETSSVASALTGRAHDVVRIAAYAYIADQVISRGTQGDVHHEGWHGRWALRAGQRSRLLEISATSCAALEQALGFATETSGRFAFSRRPQRERDQMPLFDEQGAGVATRSSARPRPAVLRRR